MGGMSAPHYALKLLLARSEQEILFIERQLLWTTDHAERLTLNDKLADLHVNHENLKAILAEQDLPK
jgi:hypothetical protein